MQWLRTPLGQCSSPPALGADDEIGLVVLHVAGGDLARRDLARSLVRGARDVVTTARRAAAAGEEICALVRRFGATSRGEHCEKHDHLVHAFSSFRRLDLFQPVLHDRT